MSLLVKSNTICLTTKLSLNALDWACIGMRKGYFYFEYTIKLDDTTVSNIIADFNTYQNRILDFAFDHNPDTLDHFKELYHEVQRAAFTKEDNRVLQREARIMAKKAKEITNFLQSD